VVGGYCFAGNTALAAVCDVLIATETSSIGMGGPAMISGGGLGEVSPDEVGPTPALSAAGVVDVRVPDDASAVEAPLEEFWRAIKLDLYGTFLGCRFGIPEIAKAGGGSVINMSSNVALMGVPGRDCYTAAKGGIAAITRSLAFAFAPQ
jgi:NAD(P)-dependent dehydrogenase (short-subunit alcohol dehydrogenase family)